MEEAKKTVRSIVMSRTETNKVMLVNCTIEHTVKGKVNLFEMWFAIEWWQQYRVYRALPVEQVEIDKSTRWHYGRYEIPSAWFCWVRRYFRTQFNVRHVHNLNSKNNAKRVNRLLGLQEIIK